MKLKESHIDGKVIKLKESDIKQIIKRVISEQKQYSDDDYDYSFYKGVNASKIEREIKDIISEKLKIRKTDLYNKNPHLEEDIKRLSQRIMSDVYSNVISYLSENYENEIEKIISGDFE
jgi:hypothetical protein